MEVFSVACRVNAAFFLPKEDMTAVDKRDTDYLFQVTLPEFVDEER